MFPLNKSYVIGESNRKLHVDDCLCSLFFYHLIYFLLRPALSGALIPPSTRLAAGQIVTESRFTLKRSICLSNDGHIKKHRDIQAPADAAIVHQGQRTFSLLMYAAR